MKPGLPRSDTNGRQLSFSQRKVGIMGRLCTIPPIMGEFTPTEHMCGVFLHQVIFCVTQVTPGAVPVAFYGKEQQNSEPLVGSQSKYPPPPPGTLPTW